MSAVIDGRARLTAHTAFDDPRSGRRRRLVAVSRCARSCSGNEATMAGTELKGRLLISHRYAAKRDTFPMTEFRIANYARTRTGRWLHDRAQFRRSCQAA
jgi:hypothetical protein